MNAPFRDLFSRGAAAYARHRPVYPERLFDWLARRAPSLDRAWDCATGSGQAARGLAERFAEVVATDASASQLACARSHSRIRYRTARAESSGLDAASVDLVAVAQALHWFDADRFHEEVRRVARPGAVVAAWGYGLLEVTPDVDRVLRRFADDRVGRYWPDERRHVEDGYAALPWPHDRMDTPSFEMTASWTLDDLLGYLGTWSAVRRYRDQRCVDPLPRLRAELLEPWGDAGRERRVRFPLFVLAGRLAPCRVSPVRPVSSGA